MKIHCKQCNNALTREIEFIDSPFQPGAIDCGDNSKFRIGDSPDDYDTKFISDGICFHWHKQHDKSVKVICTSLNDGHVHVSNGKNGCCDYSNCDILCQNCGTIVGTSQRDCWQINGNDFATDKVTISN